MNHDQRKLARHALGLENGQKQSYRNRFVVMGGTKDFDEWMQMFAEGEAVRIDPAKGSQFYRFELTRLGGERALNNGESLDPEDF